MRTYIAASFTVFWLLFVVSVVLSSLKFFFLFSYWHALIPFSVFFVCHYWFCSVAQSCLTLCDPMDCSTPGFPVHHQLLKLAQTHVHLVGDAIQPSHLCHPLLLLPSIFLSIRILSNESVLRIRWPKYWSFSINISSSNENPGLISFRMDWLDQISLQSKGFSRVFSNTTVQNINSSALSLLHSPTLTSIHDHWKNHSLD